MKGFSQFMDSPKPQLKSLSLSFGKVIGSIAVCAFLPGVMDEVHCRKRSPRCTRACKNARISDERPSQNLPYGAKISHMKPVPEGPSSWKIIVRKILKLGLYRIANRCVLTARAYVSISTTHAPIMHSAVTCKIDTLFPATPNCFSGSWFRNISSARADSGSSSPGGCWKP